MIPDYLTRYYQQGENPFLSLNMLPLDKADEVRRNHCKKLNIDNFYADETYLQNRIEIEQWMYKEFVRKGGKPKEKVPIYMTLGESVGGGDIRLDIQQNACELKIPLKYLDLECISFTLEDSMVDLIFDDNCKLIDVRRTNTPNVYLFEEIQAVADRYHIYDEPVVHYFEAQVWNQDMLKQFLFSNK